MTGIMGGIKGTMKKKVVLDAGVDTSFANVTLLLSGDNLLDTSTSPKTVTANGNATISTTTKKYGTGSFYLDGNSYFSIPGGSHFDFGTGDFTIEFWLNLSAITGSWAGGYLTTWHDPGASSTNGWSISSSNNSTFDISFGGMLNSSSNYGMPGVDLTPYANTWVHYAVTRTGATLTQYLNGTQKNTYNIGAGTPIYYPSTPLWIGKWGNGFNGITGYMDDIRITKGAARYTANFTPPTTALPTSTGTSSTPTDQYVGSVSLLLNGEDLLDKSANNNTVVAYGNATTSTSAKKYGTKSLYFDGTGDYITLNAASSLFNYGTGNFTIEFHVYPLGNAVGTYNPTMFTNHGDGDWNSSGNGIRIHHSNVLVGGGQINYSSAIPANTWTHVALVRNGNTITMYHNGTSVGSMTTSSACGSSTDRPALATSDSVTTSGREFFYGYIDDLRITKGTARYTSNFTVPTSFT
jgi:hypothetical protein